MDNPLVNVCIPAYNAEKTLRATLDSILRQDYPTIEIVVSDNRSTDATRDVIRTYGDRGVRLCVPPEQPDWAAGMPTYIGAYANASFVLSQGQGEFICLYHADDVYEPQIIRRQVMQMQAYPQVGAVFTQLRTIGEDGRPIRMGVPQLLPPELRGRQIFDFDELLNAILAYSNFLHAPSVMMRRSVFEALGGFDERKFFTSADLEMWLRIAQHYEIGLIHEPLLNYRVSQKQSGAQYNKLRTAQADYFRVLDHFLAQPNVRRKVKASALALYELHRAGDHVLCAMNLLAQGKVAEAQARLREALHVQHFVTALRRPRWLAFLLVGAGLLVSTCLGLGTTAGRRLYCAYQREVERRQKPVTESD